MSLLWHDPVAAEALGLPVVGPVPLDVVRVDAVAVAALQVPEARAARHAALGAPQPRQDHGPVAAVALALRDHENWLDHHHNVDSIQAYVFCLTAWKADGSTVTCI